MPIVHQSQERKCPEKWGTADICKKVPGKAAWKKCPEVSRKWTSGWELIIENPKGVCFGPKIQGSVTLRQIVKQMACPNLWFHGISHRALHETKKSVNMFSWFHLFISVQPHYAGCATTVRGNHLYLQRGKNTVYKDWKRQEHSFVDHHLEHLAVHRCFFSFLIAFPH